MPQVKFRVWWIPQVPGKAFEEPVADAAQGLFLCNVLGRYDAFQFDNRIKPDYCNAGGVSYSHPALTDGEWWDWPDDAEEVADLVREIAEHDAKVPS